MHLFSYVEGASAESAIRAVSENPQAAFFAGGTTLIDLMKLDVMSPEALVDINRLPFSSIDVDGAEISIGANVRNSDLAFDRAIRERFPVLSEALVAGSSAQLRNMATTAGNIMQRTRCNYFRDIHSNCNKRNPGSGCDALTGIHRGHAILGTSDQCIAANPSDMCVALVMLDAQVHTRRRDGSQRSIPFEDFHLLPGATPDQETVLEHSELITHVYIPALPMARRSHYVKVRDRASYEFALASAAVALDLNGEIITQARVGLGGIATKPWRSHEAEAALRGKKTVRESCRRCLSRAQPRKHNAFKVELAKRTLVFALEELLSRKIEEAN